MIKKVKMYSVVCDRCGKPIINEDSINAIANLYEKEGSDAWYKYEASEILPKGFKCECGCTEFTKEMDIMDDLAKLNETISKANTAEQWVTANSDLYKLSAKVEALLSLSSLAGKEEALAKLADMKDTWGDDFKNVVVRSELAAYLTKDELLQA